MTYRHTLGIQSLVLLLLGLGSLPNPINAYTFNYTDSGNTIRWEESCFYYTLHEDGAPGIEIEQLEEAIKASFDQWNAPECSYFHTEETDERASCDETGFNESGGNMNLLVWRKDKWPIEWGSQAMAMTTVLYDLETGRIVDADIEFNSVNFDFGLNAQDGKVDIRNTATHEIGHMLGLEHSDVKDATMSEAAESGEIDKRDLHEDDINGLCNLYPVEKDPEICDEPICGLNTTCEPLDNGCVAFQKEKEAAPRYCSTIPGIPRDQGLINVIQLLF